LLALAIAAEEYLLGLGYPNVWGYREKYAFDAAVRALMIRQIAEPAMTEETNIGEAKYQFPKKMPEIESWKAIASDYGKGGLGITSFQRG